MSKLYGVPNGLLVGQHSRVDELNERINSRQFSDKPLAPNFDPRPVMTKYAYFPGLDRRPPSNIPIKSYLDHSVISNFSPATQNGPPTTYFNSIDTESILRNQTVSLQKGTTQGTYVPSSDSDLYKVDVPSKQSHQPHPSLFHHQPINSTQRELKTSHLPIGKDTLHNHTRVQLRSL